jgi:1-acyl-sn-glycerol-3-phosphate acyltransferase
MNPLANVGGVARSCVRRILRFYYPRIEIDGRERIPPDGAVLFVANHPNSLMDPAVIGFTARRPVHFFAKAPLFDVPVFGALMHALGMVPAYRGQDDKASVRKNLETLDVGAKYLGRGEAVGIFPEGKTHDREGVEQVRTGAARIAASAVTGGAALQIVPLGLNYERKERFRSAIWVRVGEPIDATKIFREHGGEERKAMRSLTEEIDRRLKQVVVHLNEERWQPFLPELEVLLPPTADEAREPIATLRARKQLADAINFFFDTDRPRAEVVGAAMEQHRAQLAVAGLTVDSPVLRLGVTRLTLRLLADTLRLLIGLVPALAGTLHHLVPFAITRGLVQLVKHPGRATLALNRLMIGLPVYGFWYAAVWWLLATRTQVWIAWLWTGLMPLAGVAALHYFWRARHAGRAWWQELKMILQPARLRRLRVAQINLRRQLEQLRAEYQARPAGTSAVATGG